MGYPDPISPGIAVPEAGYAGDATFEELQIAFEASMTGISWLDAEGIFRTVRHDYFTMLGYGAGELEGQSWTVTVPPEEVAAGERAWGRMREDGRALHDSKALRKDGTVFYQRLLLVRTDDDQGRFIGHYCFMRDITRWQLAETARRNAEEFSSTLLDSMKDGLCVSDASGRLIRINDAFLEMTGFSREELMNADLPHPCWPQEQPDQILEIFGQPPFQSAEAEVILCRKDGSRFPAISSLFTSKDSNGNPIHVATIKDISAMKEAERRLAEAQRLKTIGTLAGGIAHDLNNLLTPILGSADLVLAEGTDTRQASALIQAAAERARELIEQLLNFSSARSTEKKPVSVSKSLRDAVQFVRGSLPANVQLEIRSEAENDSILGTEARIMLLILNLVSNAGEAMRECGGDLVLRLDNPDADSLRLQVIDSGCGIPAQNLDNIFDAFFTTRIHEQGTGLGLMMVKQAVTDHGGSIGVSSEPGKGSTFTVNLPLAPRGMLVSERPCPQETPVRSLHIMVVDDDAAILEVSREMLDHLGHRCRCFTDPREALAQDMDDYDLLITDFRMNGTSGIEFVRQLESFDGPVLLMTGLYDDSEELPSGFSGKLGKPFKLDSLRRAIESATS